MPKGEQEKPIYLEFVFNGKAHSSFSAEMDFARDAAMAIDPLLNKQYFARSSVISDNNINAYKVGGYTQDVDAILTLAKTLATHDLIADLKIDIHGSSGIEFHKSDLPLFAIEFTELSHEQHISLCRAFIKQAAYNGVELTQLNALREFDNIAHFQVHGTQDKESADKKIERVLDTVVSTHLQSHQVSYHTELKQARITNAMKYAL